MDTLLIEATSHNIGGWNFVISLIIPALVAAIVTLFVNWAAAKWRVRYEFELHKNKFLFERKVDTISLMVQIIDELDTQYGGISSRGLKVAQEDQAFWEKFQNKCFELNRTLEQKSLYLGKDLQIKIDQYFRFMMCLDWQYEECYNRDKKSEEDSAFVMREKKIKNLIKEIQEAVARELKNPAIDANIYLVREAPPRP